MSSVEMVCTCGDIFTEHRAMLDHLAFVHLPHGPHTQPQDAVIRRACELERIGNPAEAIDALVAALWDAGIEQSKYDAMRQGYMDAANKRIKAAEAARDQLLAEKRELIEAVQCERDRAQAIIRYAAEHGRVGLSYGMFLKDGHPDVAMNE